MLVFSCGCLLFCVVYWVFVLVETICCVLDVYIVGAVCCALGVCIFDCRCFLRSCLLTLFVAVCWLRLSVFECLFCRALAEVVCC